MRAIRELKPGDTRWQRFCDRLADAVLFAAGQGETHQPMRQTIYDALGDVFGDHVTPDELMRLADVILKALRCPRGVVDPRLGLYAHHKPWSSWIADFRLAQDGQD